MDVVVGSGTSPGPLRLGCGGGARGQCPRSQGADDTLQAEAKDRTSAEPMAGFETEVAATSAATMNEEDAEEEEEKEEAMMLVVRLTVL